jgi:hypothetical protein
MWRQWDRCVVDIRFVGIMCLLCGWSRWLDGERSSGELDRRESGQLDSTSRAEMRSNSNGWRGQLTPLPATVPIRPASGTPLT